MPVLVVVALKMVPNIFLNGLDGLWIKLIGLLSHWLYVVVV